ncbi:bifunctional lysylphosphatidylglycerol flippase/synthetase MprF [Pararhodospirillum photometricum]|uniref:Phosphatidylglycerol lysyltransferase n=1 Tax=Pararhodospirillum photometricum DSM 122 TaxID=1150469 RepID=H6SS25_PARPM|nr:bifunctional lysylphosphatidylglycerol flippase/synthetase MprF [Pararhodospirillum photometricum]CCG07704.1 Putative uncharacterized protein [Pararhodospirillum photometricum DSM 122]
MTLDSDPDASASGGSSPVLARVLAWASDHRNLLISLATLAVLGLVGVTIGKLVREVHYQDVVAALQATPLTSVLQAIAFTVIGFIALSFYDVAALAYIGRSVPYRAVGLTAFCAYAVGNTAGFGPLTGGAIRLRFYAPYGLEPEDAGKVILFVTTAFGLGLTVLTSAGLLVSAQEISPFLGLDPLVLELGAGATLAVLFALGALAGRGDGTVGWGRFTLRLPRPRILLGQLAATTVDVVACAGVLWILLPTVPIDFPAFVALFAVAMGIGVLSHVPGGLGVLEAILIATLGDAVPMDRLLGALILFRVIYYILPLLIAAVVVSLVELKRLVEGPAASRVIGAGGRLAPPVLSTLTLILGAMLVFSGVTPAHPTTLSLLSQWVPLPIVEAAHFLASILGLMLVIVARGLAFRLDGAWWTAIGAAAIAGVLSLLKALALGEFILLVLLSVALLATRAEFRRPAALVHQILTAPWLAAVGTVVASAFVLLFITYREVEYSHDLWGAFDFSEEASRSLRALLAVTLGAAAVALWSLLRPASGRSLSPHDSDLSKAIALVETQPSAGANLVRMGDKSLMFSDDERAFIMYGRHGLSWVALFDPIGARDAWPELVWRFVETAREAGGRAVFYQVAPENLALYADAGLSAFKLGEEAHLDLTTFSLSGSRRYGLRQTLSRGRREGLEVNVLSPADTAAVMDRLQEISDAWMAQHQVREKRFSLGAFEPDYVLSQPVAVLRVQDRIMAFATLLTTSLKEEVSIDLMRFDPEGPRSGMEFLFLCLMERFQAEGYRSFNLGMAPLAGLRASVSAPVWHRVGRAVYEHGERFYNFQGLRAFKAKFAPDWQPRYMAVAGGLNPALALADTAFLISGGLKGVIGK